MKILTTNAYRKLVNLCDSLSEKLYNEKGYTSRLLQENIELQKRVDELEKKLSRNMKRDAKGLFVSNNPPIAKISATLTDCPGENRNNVDVKASGIKSNLRLLANHIKIAIS